MKKFLSLFLCVMLILLVGVASVSAADASEGLSFTSNGDGTCSVTGIGTCTDTDVVIPAYSPDGDRVTVIGAWAFAGCSSLTSIEMPEGVTSIGNNAFQECSNLTSIEIPKGVTSIEAWAFEGCSGLTSITIPDSVTSIGISHNAIIGDQFGNVFANCVNLTDITVSSGNTTYHSDGNCIIETASKTLIAGCNTSVIPTDGSVTSIRAWAFEGCSGLVSIAIPESVTSIGFSAFYGCNSLINITIPDSVIRIGGAAFRYCDNLTDITVSSGNTTYHSDGNCIVETATRTLIAGCNTSVIPTDGSVTSIDGYAFSCCSGLTNITIPDSVTSIGFWAFQSCNNLTSITISDSVKSIGNNAFYGCGNLISIHFNGTEAQWNAIEKNGEWDTGTGNYTVYFSEEKNASEGLSFSSNGDGTCSVVGIGTCTDTDIVIPQHSPDGDRVTSIGDFAFKGCNSLTSVTIPGSVTSIGECAFNLCTKLASINIPESVTSIGINAFWNCTSLNNVVIPASVTSMGEGVFQACSSLTSITIPDSVTSLGHSAFRGCSSLVNITISQNITDIGKHTFRDCTSLENVILPEGVTSIGNYAFRGCSGLTSITIPDSVTSIGEGAFYGCSSLTSITIPKGVTSIGGRAFWGCSSLTSIEIPESVTSIGDFAFYGCNNLVAVYYQGTQEEWNSIEIKSGNEPLLNAELRIFSKGLSFSSNGDGTCSVVGIGTCTDTDVVIPQYSPDGDLVTSIAFEAFKDAFITSIEIPKSITSIGNNAFAGCSDLENVYYGGKQTEWNSIEIASGNEPLLNAELHVSGSVGLEYRSNGDGTCSVTSIGICTDTEIIIPRYSPYGDLVTSIGERAFSWRSSLTSIAIPERVTSIGYGAFYGCSGLTSITIPEGVTSIGDGAFEGCSGLTSITVSEGNPVYHSAGNCLIETASKTLIVGCKTSIIPTDGSVTSIGAYAFSGCNGLTSITIPEGVTSIGSYAFSGCRGLTSIEIPEGVTSIGAYAFNSCWSLTSITIPEGVTSIGNYAFANCDSFAKLVIKSKTVKFGMVFIPNSATIYGYVGSTAEAYAAANGNPFITLAEVTTEGEKTTASIDVSNIDLNSSSVVIEAVNGSQGITSSEIILTPDAVTAIGGKSSTIKTDAGTVVFDETATAKIAAAASNKTITLVITDVTSPDEAAENKKVFSVTLTADGVDLLPYEEASENGVMTVELRYEKGLSIEQIQIVYRGESGDEIMTVKSYDPETGIVVFDTTHFSDYEIRKQSVVLGDIDGDGISGTMKDAMILVRYIAQWQGYDSKIVLAAADLDGDGIPATMRDALILIRHIAQWPGYETLPKR